MGWIWKRTRKIGIGYDMEMAGVLLYDLEIDIDPIDVCIIYRELGMTEGFFVMCVLTANSDDTQPRKRLEHDIAQVRIRRSR